MLKAALRADLDAIRRKLAWMKANSPAPQMKFADIEVAMGHIESARDRNRLVMYEGYAILFDVGRPWYSNDLYLIEELILRVYPTKVPVTRAIEQLEVLALLYECKMIGAGDTQIGMMTPHYQLCGYKTLGTQLVKDVDYGIRPEADGG